MKEIMLKNKRVKKSKYFKTVYEKKSFNLNPCTIQIYQNLTKSLKKATF